MQGGSQHSARTMRALSISHRPACFLGVCFASLRCPATHQASAHSLFAPCTKRVQGYRQHGTWTMGACITSDQAVQELRAGVQVWVMRLALHTQGWVDLQ